MCEKLLYTRTSCLQFLANHPPPYEEDDTHFFMLLSLYVTNIPRLRHTVWIQYHPCFLPLETTVTPCEPFQQTAGCCLPAFHVNRFVRHEGLHFASLGFVP